MVQAKWVELLKRLASLQRNPEDAVQWSECLPNIHRDVDSTPNTPRWGGEGEREQYQG